MLDNSDYITEIANALGVDTTQALDLVQSNLQVIANYKLTEHLMPLCGLAMALICGIICSILFYRRTKKYNSDGDMLWKEISDIDEPILDDPRWVQLQIIRYKSDIFENVFVLSSITSTVLLVAFIIGMVVLLPDCYNWIAYPELMLTNLATGGVIL